MFHCHGYELPKIRQRLQTCLTDQFLVSSQLLIWAASTKGGSLSSSLDHPRHDPLCNHVDSNAVQKYARPLNMQLLGQDGNALYELQISHL